MFGKIHFSEILIFAYANEVDIAQNLIISCVFVLPEAKIIQKALFSSHVVAFGGLAKSLWVQIPFSPTAADPPGSLSDHGSGGGFWGILSLGRFSSHFGVKFEPHWGPDERSGFAQTLSK